MDDLAERPPIHSLLFSRGYGPLFFGNLLSASGTWFQNVAQALLIYRLTGSTFLVGVVNFAQFAAILVLFGVAGHVADRFDRRLVMIGTQGAAVVITAGLAVVTHAGSATSEVVVGFAFALGITTAFSMPTLQAMIPWLVKRNEIPGAIALTAVTFNLARAVGPVLGVMVISRWGLTAAFALNSLSYLGFVFALLGIRPESQPPPRRSNAPAVSALRMVRSDVMLAFPIVALGLVTFTSDPVNTLTPEFSTGILGQADTFAGVLIGAFGVGAVIAAFIAPRWKPGFRPLIASMALISAGVFSFGVSTTSALAMFSLVLAGFGFLSAVTVATSFLQLRVPDESRGRLMALWSMSFHGTRPVGSLIDGAIATGYGVRAAAAFMSLPALIGAAAAVELRRRRRRRLVEDRAG